jgi:uncharacterized protein (UPF0332 family)
MFYSVLALAVEKQHEISKHSGVISFFDRDFVKPGKFNKELSRSIHSAFNQRQNSDYGDLFEADEEQAIQAITEAEFFVNKVKEYLVYQSNLKS